jgi:hypothetical protein
MKKLLLATTAGLAVSAGGANATLTYTIWNGATVLESNYRYASPPCGGFAGSTYVYHIC